MNIFNVITLFGGLAMFLYGMRLMGDGLKASSSGTLKKAMERITGTPFKAFLLGLAVTAIIQSRGGWYHLPAAVPGDYYRCKRRNHSHRADHPASGSELIGNLVFTVSETLNPGAPCSDHWYHYYHGVKIQRLRQSRTNHYWIWNLVFGTYEYDRRCSGPF